MGTASCFCNLQNSVSWCCSAMVLSGICAALDLTGIGLILLSKVWAPLSLPPSVIWCYLSCTLEWRMNETGKSILPSSP